MRWARALVLPLLVLVLVACGSSAASSDGNGNGNGNGSSDGGEPSATTAATQDNGNGNGNGSDVEQVAEKLVPPNSSETSRTTTSGVIFVTYTSSDSPDSLKSFYENAIGQTGWHVLSTTSVSGGYSWIITSEADGNGDGGSITVAPDSSGGSGSQVLIQVGSNS